MKLVHTESSGSPDFPITPAGTHVARCVQLIDQGTQHIVNQYGDKHQRKLFSLFELPLKLNTFTDKDGNEKTLPFGMPKTYTNSTYEMATLYQHLEAWFGEAFTNDPEVFDLENMLGKACMLSISHKQGDDGKYAIISSLAALPEGMECPPQINPSIFFDLDAFDSGVFDKLSDKMKRRIMQSDEYRVLSGEVGQRPQPQQEPRQDRVNPDIDFIPF